MNCTDRPEPPNSTAAVRRASRADAAIIRHLRLQALVDAPDDFDSSLELERARPTTEWQAWIERGATFVLERAHGPCGLAAGVPADGDHQGVFLVAMWVHPDARGTGGGDALVAAVLAWAEERRAADVWLHVDKRNQPARLLYERNGFRATGEEIVRQRNGLPELEMRLMSGGQGRR